MEEHQMSVGGSNYVRHNDVAGSSYVMSKFNFLLFREQICSIFILRLYLMHFFTGEYFSGAKNIKKV